MHCRAQTAVGVVMNLERSRGVKCLLTLLSSRVGGRSRKQLSPTWCFWYAHGKEKYNDRLYAHFNTSAHTPPSNFRVEFEIVCRPDITRVNNCWLGVQARRIDVGCLRRGYSIPGGRVLNFGGHERE